MNTAKDRRKIKIIKDLLEKFLIDWKNNVTDLNSFYYLSRANLRVYDEYLKNNELDENEWNLIKEALEFKSVSFGEYKHTF